MLHNQSKRKQNRRKANDGKQMTFFSLEERQEKLYSVSQSLEQLSRMIPWERFRPLLSTVYKDNAVKGGRPPYDEVMMFKCMVLQHLYNLSDEQLEYQLLDRLSFMKFVGISIASSVPDHNTLWSFREKLKKYGLTEKLFNLFGDFLCEKGYRIKEGIMSDATFVEVPRQRNTAQENESIKNGETPASFETKSPQTLSHKDMDARWTKKNDQTFYGYKDHVTADTDNKFIRSYEVTPANVHDSVPFLSILPECKTEGLPVYADSAYSSAEIEAELEYRKLTPEICEKGYRGKPLTAEQQNENRRKSKIRCRVEHIFGDMTNRMKVLAIRTIGLARAKVKIGLVNLTYNMRRFVSVETAAE